MTQAQATQPVQISREDADGAVDAPKKAVVSVAEIARVAGKVLDGRKIEKRLERVEQYFKYSREMALDGSLSELIMELMGYMAPMDPVGRDFERIGRDFDGGYVMVKHEGASKVAYSLGINRDVSWDLAMAKRGFHIFQYDHTIEKLPAQHANFRFFKRGITGTSGVDDVFTSVEDELKSNGHRSERGMVLKMDIEGSEWDVFSEMPQEVLGQFDQIVMECHGFDKVGKLFWFRKARESLRRLAATHHVVHVHGNNNSALTVVGGVPISKTLELTWFRQGLCAFEPSRRCFPTALDQKNNPLHAEHFLGSFRVA
jgi:hypothetical protein